MVEIVEGNIFESGCEMLVNPVNTMGVMGAGLAKQFKERFPEIMDPYVAKCKDGWKIGEILSLKNPTGELPKWIVCYPTKTHWKLPSTPFLIQKGMESLLDEIAFTGTKSVAIPALGAGLGGLLWRDVKKFLLGIPWPDFLVVRIYPPIGPGEQGKQQDRYSSTY